ncbi:MFS transporter [Agromyces seonyuensis]|uniref:MFS transporter n=1 Tax=Agromyces seonyuensis TaxID=2662446 RepID=A0A6I4P563_9MICO|nr:MFS transporter [Agromyces seonyuensis]MWC00136.1 MFS transporter [Agromyces seonyuensis]
MRAWTTGTRIILAVVVIALVVRAPFVAVAPVSGRIGADFLLTAAQVGLLTSLPVLCFALFTPLASLLIARLGPDLATTVSLTGLTAGILLRSAGGEFALFAGTIVLGAFITIGNVVVPVLIRRDVSPRRAALATGLFTSGMNVGTLTATIATEPLAAAAGWRLAIGLWALVGVVAIVVWMLVVGPGRALRTLPPILDSSAPHRLSPVAADATTDASTAVPPAAAGPADLPGPAHDRPAVARSLTAILLLAAFGAQAFSYYGVTAWLPAILGDRLGYTPAQAGGGAGVFQVMAIAGALGVPLVNARFGARASAVIVGALWLTVPLGLLSAPGQWLLWLALGGMAQGAGFVVVFALVVALAGSDSHARRLSAFVQGGGYALGATAATVVGAAHDLSGDWVVPLVVLVGSTSVFAFASIAAATRAGRTLR